MSRELSITATRASQWRDKFLATGQAGLTSRSDRGGGRRPPSATGQDRRTADGERVAVREGGPAGVPAALWPAGGRRDAVAPSRSPPVGRMGCSASAACLGRDRGRVYMRGGRHRGTARGGIVAAPSARPRTRSWWSTFAGCSRRRRFMATGYRKVWARTCGSRGFVPQRSEYAD